jgi:CP family cyanate transporter-like MFS transporter
VPGRSAIPPIVPPVIPPAAPPTTAGGLPLWAGRTAALLGILLVALSLRSAVAALSPILDQVSVDIPLSAVVIGIIGAAPPITFALSGLLTPRISRSLGLEGSTLLAVGAMVVGHVARALAPGVVGLVVATVVTLIGVGMGNVLLPPIVKRYFPDRLALVTTLYATVISISTAIPALAAVPVAESFGWRYSLGIWAVVALLAVAPWVRLTMTKRRDARAGADDPGVESEPALEGRLWRSPVAWALTITFTASSLNVYAMFAWLPKVLITTAGVSPAGAGAMLSLYAFMGFPASLVVPLIAARIRNVGWISYFAVACFVIGYLGLIFAPAAAPIVWVIFAGVGALLFPLALYLINSRTRTHVGSVALSGFVQGLGYVIAAVGPLLFGILADATGGWTASLLFLLGFSLLGIVGGLLLARPRFLEDDLRAPLPLGG